MAPSGKTSFSASRLLLYAGILFTFAGFVALLFDLHPLRQPDFGWITLLIGLILLLVAFALHLRPAANTQTVIQPTAPRNVESTSETSFSTAPTSSSPRPLSFVANSETPSQPDLRKEVLSKAITPEILNIRFAAYRCEIAKDHFKAVYQNATQNELKWYEIGSLVIRQFPLQPPWEGKLLVDIVPIAVAGEKINPVRILSTTYVNYGFLPQGQSASTRENLRRFANFILSQNRSIFVDPGTDSFVHAGQPPVRFLSMAQFMEYDTRYG